jgi:uncharacterized membrane protein YedE/YeeE
MRVFVQFAIGLIFGLGLVIAGMSNPAKVLNFLDLAAIPGGRWDPSLAFVLIGAIAVTALGYRLVLKREAPVFGGAFQLPTVTTIDARILTGPAIFGIGWGLAGFCPGPAFTALGAGSERAALFVVMMMIGMAAARAGLRGSPTLDAPLPRA